MQKKWSDDKRNDNWHQGRRKVKACVSSDAQRTVSLLSGCTDVSRVQPDQIGASNWRFVSKSSFQAGWGVSLPPCLSLQPLATAGFDDGGCAIPYSQRGVKPASL